MPPNWLIPNLWIINYIWVSTLDLNPLLSLAMSLNPPKRLLSPHNPATLLWSTSFSLTQVKFESWGVFSLILLSLLIEGLEKKLLCKSQTNLPKSAYTFASQPFFNSHWPNLHLEYFPSMGFFQMINPKEGCSSLPQDQKNVWFQIMNLSPLVTSIETCQSCTDARTWFLVLAVHQTP